MKYKRHEETRIMCLLHLHFPLSNMAGHNLDGKIQLVKSDGERSSYCVVHLQQFEYLLN